MANRRSVAVGAAAVAAVAAASWLGTTRTALAPAALAPSTTASASPLGAPVADAGARDADPLDEWLLGDVPRLSASASELPPDAPKQVRFGVVLVAYRGAEGAGPHARSKGEAFALARSLAELGEHDFRAAVQRGDAGSTSDAGRMPRGVLEPTVERALFTLPKGGVSPPVDTPRGFWVLRRVD